MAPPKFASALEASSYHHPSGGEAYAPLREAIVKRALDMGYDGPSMLEHGVDWAGDQDPWGHIANANFPNFTSACNFRLFESFEEYLKDKYVDLMKARGIGVLVNRFEVEIKRPVSYPDVLIVANRIDVVKQDRYHVFTTHWSLRQQAVVAETHGWVVFFDYPKGKPANLLEAGGVHADLYHGLLAKSKIMNEKRAVWDAANPKKQRGPKPTKL